MLVTFDIQKTIKPVSSNNQAIFEQISEEIENYYLPHYLGRSFAYDVQTNPGDYTALLEGVEFDDCGGNPIKFKGLYYVLAYFIYAEYLEKTKYKDTNTGFVTKTREEAAVITQGQEEKLKNYNRRLAESEVEVMEMYLNENTDIYTLWKCNIKKPYTPRLTSIKKVN